VRAVLVLLAALALVGYHYLSTRAVAHGPGVLVPDDPRQSDPDSAAPISDKDFTLKPRARFAADARVLSLEHYRSGKLADIVPLDIAVGWGRMSDSDVLAKIQVTQGNRFYYWHYDDEPPIPREEIEEHSANWHMVPANDAVWHTLSNVRVGQIVHLEGYLVDIDSAETGSIRTSLTRDDTGAGACEIIYVEAAGSRAN